MSVGLPRCTLLDSFGSVAPAHKQAHSQNHRRPGARGVLGLVLLALAGRLLPCRAADQGLVPALLQAVRNGRTKCPFYSWPTVAAVRVWLRQIGRRKFVYTVKATELITHVKRFAGTKTLIRDFGHIADLLGRRMGCFLFQLPPSFHYTPARLKRIVSQLDPAHRNVVEFRHRSWWNDRVFTAFRAAGAIFCSCSAPRLPEELVTTAEDIYLRFHGTKQWYRHDYSPLELATWAARIRVSGAKRVWAYFNNDRNGYAIKNARELRRQLSLNVH